MKRRVKLTVALMAALGVGLLGARWARADESTSAACDDAAAIEQLIRLHVELGQMAEHQSDNPQINRLGHWMVRRLDSVGDKLLDHARSQHCTIVGADTKVPELIALRTAVTRLDDMRGAEFDGELAAQLGYRDQASLDLVRRIAGSTNDRELKTILRETRPILRTADAKATHFAKTK